MAQASKTTKKAGVSARISKYLKDVLAELKRVTWPTRDEVANSTVIVIATLAFFILLTLVVDNVSSFVLINWLAEIGR